MNKKEISIDKIRNIGFIAHIDAGKTTTTERVLFYTGRIYRMGEVDEGTATTDWMPQEQERGITITSAATYCEWKGHNINIIDTPGHVDFTIEVERSMRILDGVIVIFCAVGGVQPQVETVWRQADKYGIPRIGFINKMDRTGANFLKVIEEIRKKLNNNVFPLQLPFGEGEDFKGIIDILHQKLILYEDELGLYQKEAEIPENLQDEVAKYRKELIERIVEVQDNLMLKYLECGELNKEEIIKGLREATINLKIIPILCGSALKNKGVQPILDSICDYLPSPLDLPIVRGINPISKREEERKCRYDEPFSSLAFKIANDTYMDNLTYIRVYSGKISSPSNVYNSSKEKKERIMKILRMHANHREEIKELKAGEIGAVLGLKWTITGDTLCEEKNPIVLEKINFPEPVIYVAIEPKTLNEEEKMLEALDRLSKEDPTFRRKYSDETGQTIISGMGELHLEIIMDRLFREFNIQANVGRPQVAYKETIKQNAEAEGKYIKQIGGNNNYGHVILRVEPSTQEERFIFIDESKDESIPHKFIPAIEDGIRESLDAGVLAGYPMVNIKVTLLGGSSHQIESTDMAFKMASSIAFKNAVLKAEPCLLEPIMLVEIITPDEYLGDIIADLNSRRGRMEGIKIMGDSSKAVKSYVFLSEMFGYATALRSLSKGRATFTMEFSHYEEVSSDTFSKIILKGGSEYVQAKV